MTHVLMQEGIGESPPIASDEVCEGREQSRRMEIAVPAFNYQVEQYFKRQLTASINPQSVVEALSYTIDIVIPHRFILCVMCNSN